MALSAVSPGIALRVTRAAVGRRALEVVLLVGGLFVLGLLCGEQAHAVDGVVPAAPTISRSQAPSPSSASPSDSSSGSGSEQPELPGASTLVTDKVPRVVRPVTEEVARSVTELVTPPAAEYGGPPIGDLVDQITAGITDGVGDGAAGGIGEQPAPPQWWPSLPQVPTLPGLPGLPGLPELPGLPLPAVPGQTLPAGTAAQQQQPGGAADRHQAAGKPSHGESASVYGPRFAGGPGPMAGDDARHPTHTHVTGAVRAPVHQIPDGGPTDTSGRHSAGDNGSPRHGDAQAVTSNERARPTLVPGTTADVPAARARDRHRDIPAFPG